MGDFIDIRLFFLLYAELVSLLVQCSERDRGIIIIIIIIMFNLINL